jgi:hypothetical protein
MTESSTIKFDPELLAYHGLVITIRNGSISISLAKPTNAIQTKPKLRRTKYPEKLESLFHKDDIHTIEKKKSVKKKKSCSFIPPTLEEVTSYCQERNNKVDPQLWYDFYQSKGWMVGKNKMKDWKSAVRTWERNRLQSQTIVPQSSGFNTGKYAGHKFRTA